VVVAIAPFEVQAGISQDDVETVADIFTVRLQSARAVRVVMRDRFASVMREHQFQMTDFSNDEKTAELGKALNADWIVRVSVRKLQNRLVVTAMMIDMQTLEVMGGAPMVMSDIGESYDKMQGFVAEIMQTITGSTGLAVRPPVVRPGAVPEGFVRVEAGTFMMGSANGGDNEKPVHQVTISKSFYMSEHEVTQKEWREVMGTTVQQQRDMADPNWPMRGEGDDYPMYYVSWYEAIEYCNKRSVREGLRPAYGGSGNNITCDFSANGYRLPTEAEWEYAARGANKDTMQYEYAGSNSVGAVAWYEGNSGNQTHPVGTKLPNSLGIYTT
jgi:formylglycine-generating enzyme required for sulfatase activity